MAEDQQAYNWNIDEMPWKSNMSPQNGSSVILFNGKSLPTTTAPVPSTSGINLNRPPRMKRKTLECNYL